MQFKNILKFYVILFCVFNFIYLFFFRMEEALANLHKQFPSLPPKSLMKLYKARLERMRLLTIHGIPNDIRWIIEAHVRLTGEISDSFVSRLPGLGKSKNAKKRRAKRMCVCFKCA